MNRSIAWRPSQVVCFLALSMWATAGGAASAGPAEDYLDAQLRVVRGLENRLDAVADIAEDAAGRLLAGGGLYLAGEPGIVSELLGRAGGLCGAKPLPKDVASLSANDVVLFGHYRPASTALKAWDALRSGKAMVVAFVPHGDPILAGALPAHVRPIVVDVPWDGRLVTLADGTRLVPLAPPAIATAEWTFTAELIGACRRHRRQLAVYLSIHLDEGRKRYERTRGLMFEPDFKPQPSPRKKLGGEFLASVRGSLEAIRKSPTEMAALRKAAEWIKEAGAAKGRRIANFQGHMPPQEAGGPGDPGLFQTARPSPFGGDEGVRWAKENLRPGDLWLFLGYQQSEDAMAAAANARGARTIFITSTPSGPDQARQPKHLYINPHWPLTDGCLELPGYDVKACPMSAILGMTCYHAICGEAIHR